MNRNDRRRVMSILRRGIEADEKMAQAVQEAADRAEKGAATEQIEAYAKVPPKMGDAMLQVTATRARMAESERLDELRLEVAKIMLVGPPPMDERDAEVRDREWAGLKPDERDGAMTCAAIVVAEVVIRLNEWQTSREKLEAEATFEGDAG